jgi:hypothetical protein
MRERRWIGMSNKPSLKVMAKEAAYWERMKKVLKENPGKVCHK